MLVVAAKSVGEIKAKTSGRLMPARTPDTRVSTASGHALRRRVRRARAHEDSRRKGSPVARTPKATAMVQAFDTPRKTKATTSPT